MVGRTVEVERARVESGRPTTPRWRRRTAALAVLGAVGLLAATALAGCATVPQAVINVPGNYVADLWQPTLDHPSGASSATVLVCLDTPSALLIETGDGGEGSVGAIRLDWAGVQYSEPGTGSAITMTTPVLDPGCGVLWFAPDCCHVDHYLAVKVTKV